MIDYFEVAELRKHGKTWQELELIFGLSDTQLARNFHHWQRELHTQAIEGFHSPLSDTEWAIHYCGYQWLNDYLITARKKVRESLKLLLFLPRGSGKSQLCISSNTQYILETHQPTLILTSGPASANRLFGEVRRIIESDALIHDYGSKIFSNIDSRNRVIKLRRDLRLSKDPLLRIAPRGADVIGSHPRRLWSEDIVQEEFRSHESNDALKKWYANVVQYCATFEPGNETQLLGTGTRKGPLDFYNYLITDLRYPTFRLPALELLSGRYPELKDIDFTEDGREIVDLTLGEYKHLNIPTHPLEKLLIARATNPYDFSTNMQNDPISESGVYFKKEELHLCNFEPTKWHKYIIAVDPAFGVSKRSDNTAIVCMAQNIPHSNYYTIVEVFADKIKDIKPFLLDMYERWNDLGQVLKVVCESNYIQKIFIIEQLQDKLPFDIVPFHSTADKVSRIQSLKSPINRKKIKLWKEARGKQKFMDEFLQFIPMPSTASRKDDILDATQSCYESWVRHQSYIKPISGRTSSAFAEAYIYK